MKDSARVCGIFDIAIPINLEGSIYFNSAVVMGDGDVSSGSSRGLAGFGRYRSKLPLKFRHSQFELCNERTDVPRLEGLCVMPMTIRIIVIPTRQGVQVKPFNFLCETLGQLACHH